MLEKLWPRKKSKKPLLKPNIPGNEQVAGKEIGPHLLDNLALLQEEFNHTVDYNRRELIIGDSHPAVVVYIDSLTDRQVIDNMILEPLMTFSRRQRGVNLSPREIKKTLLTKVLPVGGVKEAKTFGQAIAALLDGYTLFLLEGEAGALILESKSLKSRSVEEPKTEPSVRGPRDAFTENIKTNVSLIRRRLQTPRLKTESQRIGRLSRTQVLLVYLEGVANPNLVQEIRKRLSHIDIDAVLESGYIEELIQDHSLSPFPVMDRTERPDKLAADLLEGRVAIFVDNTPFVLLCPSVFMEFLQSPEDYYMNYYMASLLRLLRFLCWHIALLFPSLYVALTTFHHELIPTTLLLNLAAQREAVPFPAIVEALIMEITFEILREAGIRLPRTVGSAVSIVGALVVGEAAVRAGLVSPSMVITVALTAIASFVIPSYTAALSIRMLRFLFMIVAATLGLYGIIIGFLLMLIHIASLRPFGVPYLYPIGPTSLSSLKDTFVRVPWWTMWRLPKLPHYNKTFQNEMRLAPERGQGPIPHPSRSEKH